MGNWSVYDAIGSGYADKMFFNNNGQDYGTDNHNSVVGRGGDEDSANGQYRTRANGYNDVDFSAGYKDGAEIGIKYGDYTAATIGSDNIELSVNNMYPGYGQLFRSDIINLGTVAAKLSALSFSAAGTEGGTLDADTAGMLGLALRVCDEQDKEIYDLSKESNATFTLGGVTFVRLSALTDATVETLNQMMTASDPMGRMDLYIGVAMDPDAAGVYTTGSTAVKATNEDANTQNQLATISVDFAWDQFNAELDAN
ncbi:hypothetical protein [Oscillibacter sp. GMB15532]|uniref:hypothetical protein n=1 Tax=Oscillibacter sp. GMB15532 TaxID=3230022 RepID=UPI0034DFFFAD